MTNEKEENIINIRIDSDDLLQIFGFLGILIAGTTVPKELNGVANEVIMEAIKRITYLNINNPEFIKALKKDE